MIRKEEFEVTLYGTKFEYSEATLSEVLDYFDYIETWGDIVEWVLNFYKKAYVPSRFRKKIPRRILETISFNIEQAFGDIQGTHFKWIRFWEKQEEDKSPNLTSIQEAFKKKSNKQAEREMQDTEVLMVMNGLASSVKELEEIYTWRQLFDENDGLYGAIIFNLNAQAGEEGDKANKKAKQKKITEQNKRKAIDSLKVINKMRDGSS